MVLEQTMFFQQVVGQECIEGVKNIKDMVINLAEAEGLYAHALSIKKRAEDME